MSVSRSLVTIRNEPACCRHIWKKHISKHANADDSDWLGGPGYIRKTWKFSRVTDSVPQIIIYATAGSNLAVAGDATANVSDFSRSRSLGARCFRAVRSATPCLCSHCSPYDVVTGLVLAWFCNPIVRQIVNENDVCGYGHNSRFCYMHFCMYKYSQRWLDTDRVFRVWIYLNDDFRYQPPMCRSLGVASPISWILPRGRRQPQCPCALSRLYYALMVPWTSIIHQLR